MEYLCRMTAGTLGGIYVYPVKSCRGLQLDWVTVTPNGLANDRLWQVVDDEGVPITQRQNRLLATVQPELLDGGIRVTAPDRDPIELDHPERNDVKVQSVLGVVVDAADAGDRPAQWFSDLLGRSCRLVAMTEASDRRLPNDLDIFGQSMGFTDAAPVLVTNTASLRWLQERATEPFGMDRFRPNLTINTDEPWAEDMWQTFEVGATQLTVGVPWPRCTIPQIDQVTGARHKEPAKVLKAHRWCQKAPSVDESWRPLVEGNGLFGIGCSIGPASAELSLGDPVAVTSTAPPVLAMPG